MISSLSVRVVRKKENITERLSRSLVSLANTYDTARSTMINDLAYSFVYLGGAAFLEIFSVVISNEIPLAIGVGFLIAGVGSIIMSIIHAEKMLTVLSLAQLANAPVIAEHLWLAKQMQS